MAKKKFYVVWQGRQTGIFTDWPSTEAAVSGVAGAKYKGYASEAEAQAALKMGYQKALSAKPAAKPAGKAKAAAKPSSAALPDTDWVIYADGACDPNPGQAGTGLSLYQQGQVTELWYGLYQPMGTNNTAELNGLLAALKLAQRGVEQGASVTVLCDSQYAINCVSRWADSWKAQGWTRKGAPIKNLELIQQAYALWQTLKGRITLAHVPGHAGIEGNELADRMSVYAVEQKETALVRYPEPLDLATVLAMRAG
ncbi:viroplasmin family protein [Ferrimonas balearica]|uniref:ribonuclease H1 domain-containing protein n=1 Tax=Ferrimonas balearica TaxID=44012 RepID=UPI002D80492E|nr:ribonuclease H family protein [Ferrimonas balearica]MBY6094105.1 ribonuclease H family protein [Ferrimonas balearica]